MDSFKLQSQLRHNQEDLISYLKDFSSWEDEMKRKEAELINAGGDTVLPPIRSKKGKTLKPKGKSKVSEIIPSKPKRIASYDYSAWDKFDVDAACEEVDKTAKYELECLIEKACFEKEKGNRFVKEKKWTEAAKCYTEAITLYSKDPIYYANRALCNLKLKNFDHVEIDCTKALELDPTYVKALQRRAAARLAVKKLYEAYNDLEQVLQIEPHNKESLIEFEKLSKQLKQSESKSVEIIPKDNKNCTNVKTVDYNTINLVPSKWPIGVWPGEQNIDVINIINKSPHQRSKKPLVRVPITLTDEIEHTLDTVDKVSLSVSENLVNVSTEVNCNKNIVESKDLHIDVSSYPVPKTCLQFNNVWKNIRNTEDKFLYLMRIPPDTLPQLFKDFFESDFLSDIIKVLTEHFMNKDEKTILSYLLSLTSIKRFSTLVMFISSNEKAGICKIFNHYENFEHHDMSLINLLRVKYEIHR